MQLKTFSFIFGITAILGCSGEKFFRRDYTYYEEYNAFYKLHWADNSRDWEEAFIACDDEGAKLFYPEGPEEWMVAANLSESLTDVEKVFVGIRDEFGRGHFVSVEGHFIPELSNTNTNRDEAGSKCIVMSVTTGSYSVVSCELKRPFICKKIDNESCPTVDSGYVYLKATNKCYKVNERPKTWQDAVTTCYMEGAILSTLAESTESTLLTHLIRDHQFYFIGIRRILPQSSFYSLQGSKFDSTEDDTNGENCKVIRFNTLLSPSNDDNDNYYNGNENRIQKFELRSYNCNTPLPFVCEMNVKV